MLWGRRHRHKHGSALVTAWIYRAAANELCANMKAVMMLDRTNGSHFYRKVHKSFRTLLHLL